MCSGGVRSILLLPLVARCLEIIDVCIWRIGAQFTKLMVFHTTKKKLKPRSKHKWYSN